MEVLDTAIPEVRIVVPHRFEDERGFLSEVYDRRAFLEAGLPVDFAQENHTFTARAGTVRGLHYQMPPHAQGKLVRVTRGRIFDVAVDIRRGSPTFGRHVAVELSAEAWNQLYIPAGFAHGFCTLEPGCEVVYRMTDHYAPELERGLLWDDPSLGIEWPVAPERAVVSEKDRRNPRLAELHEAVLG